MIVDYLWGSIDISLNYITLCWTPDLDPQLQATVWLTASQIIELSTARYAHQGKVRKVYPKGVAFASTSMIDYNGDGSVTIDVCRVLDDK